GGTATLDFQPVDIGSEYDIVATSDIGGDHYVTSDDGAGDGALATAAVTNITVDLRKAGRP
ncbi:MAG TPA: hypothetical protein VGO62_13290, partial [Myxococcota bacterium]